MEEKTPKLNQMLKLYSKKELWERIQFHIKQNEQLRAENEELKQHLEYCNAEYAQLENDYRKANELGLEPSYIKWKIKENEELKQQLKEKDEEISRLSKCLEQCRHIERFDIGDLYIEYVKKCQELTKVEIDTRKQVCEKIREFCPATMMHSTNPIRQEELVHIILAEILNQIEKGENE